MNLDYLFQKIIGRATCLLGRDARLYSTARIRNASGKSAHIRVGSYSIIKGELFVFSHGGEIDIGEWCYIGDGAKIWSARHITIGNRVLISHNVNIFDSLTHPHLAKARHDQFRAIATSGHPPKLDLDEKEVRIDDDALLGANSIILRGVNVGEGAIVGAGSVVTCDVRPHTIVAGNPARVIRELHRDER